MDWIKVGIGALAGGIIAALITGLLVVHFDKPEASSGGGTEIASGAVMAFDGVSSCPSGWSAYTKAASRVIVGTGSPSGKGEDGATLTTRKPGDTAGRETMTLAATNLPPHTHQYEDIYYSESGGTVSVPNNKGSSGSDNDNKGYEMSRTTQASTTAATAFTNMPPFIALLYCVKS